MSVTGILSTLFRRAPKPRKPDGRWLDRIELKIDDLTRRLKLMSQQEADLGAALAEQGEKITNLAQDVNRLIEAVEAIPGVDLSDEIATVRAQIDALTAASDAADTAVPPTP